jgi:nitrite reductase/ring-hydroxylating ferredoxin subunit
MTELSAGTFRLVDTATAFDDDSVAPYYLTLGDLKLRVSFARIDGRVYAFGDLCPCGSEPCPLSSGLLTGRTIMCQCHGSRFDITTGAVLNGPAVAPLNLYEVRETDGEIQIRL